MQPPALRFQPSIFRRSAADTFAVIIKAPASPAGAFLLNRLMSKPALLLFGILLLTTLAYWSGLHGPLIFDDSFNLAPISQWLKGDRGWTSVVFGNTSGLLGRPVAMASFVLNVALLGPGIWGLKLVNLLIHLANGALIYALFKGLISRGGLLPRPPAAAAWLALFGASVWLLHPLLVSTVLYVVQRMAMLSALFTLLAMLAYLHGRIALEAGRERKAWALLILVPLCTVLATLSKENGVLAPALCALIELFVFAPKPGQRRPWASTIFILVTLVVPALLAITLTAMQSELIVGGYANRPFTLAERLLTQPRALWDYIGSLLLPYGPKLGLYHDDYRISHGLLDPPATLIAIAGWLAAIGLAWRLRTAIPGFALGLGIFLVGHALESTVFPLLMYFEHRNYLPAVGALWALLSLACAGAQRLHGRMHHGNGVFVFAGVGLVLVLALAAAARAGVWHSKEALLAQGLAYHPDSRWLRMDASGWALHQTPPRLDLARGHVDHLAASPDPDTRRMGAAARLIIDCSAGSGARPDAITNAFEGGPHSMEADLLLTFEGLADVVAAKPCAGLSPLQMARQLDSMLDRSDIPAQEFNMRRLRFKAARLYMQAHSEKEALNQAKLAYDENAVDAPIAAFVAELEIRQGDFAAAAKMIDIVAGKIARDDYTGHKVIEALRAKLRADQRKLHFTQ